MTRVCDSEASDICDIYASKDLPRLRAAWTGAYGDATSVRG